MNDAQFKPGSPVETVPITSGPKQHFFGYYDKFPWDASGRYVLSHEIAFDDRPPTADDKATLGLIDTRAGNRFEPLTETRAWCWQQGAMLQWHPADAENRIIYNDRRDGQFVSVIRNVHSGSERVLPRPVAAVSRDGKKALTLNYSRLADERPGYGYAGVPDPCANSLAPDDDGIYVLDLETGKCRLIVTLSQIAHMGRTATMEGAKHRFEHVLFSTDDRRFIFLHRWGDRSRWMTRLFTADANGRNVYCVNEIDMTSHFDWRDERRILAWATQEAIGNRYFLFTDRTREVEMIGDEKLTPLNDGHCSYSPDRKWIMTDTYPNEKKERKLLLYHPGRDVRIDLGDYYSVPWITECRCDLHPRWSRDGRKICFDSSHDGSRQIYVIEVAEILAGVQ